MSTAAATQFAPILVAAAASERPSLVVSLHDVAPATQKTCGEILRELAKLGVSTCSLLVVPNFHHTGGSLENADFVSWLRMLQADGHEIVIHGYYHERERRPGESLRDQFLTRVYTADEAEFYDLDYEAAMKRMQTAQTEFAAAGFKPRGFIAPAWLLSKEAERAASDAGIEYTTRLGSVRDLRHGATYRARSLVYSTRNRWRQTVSRGWNAALFHRLNDAPLMRLAIHPPDIECRAIWSQIRQLLGHAIASRTATTYADWVAQMRVRSSE